MKLSLIQWNILFKEPIKNVIELLRQHPADIICLQELSTGLPEQNNANGPAEIALALGYNYHKCDIPLVGFESGYTFTLGNGIFTRFPITAKREVVLQQATKPRNYANEKRVYIEVDIDVNGKQLTLGTTHLSFTKWFINNAKRQSETDNLLGVVKKKKQNYILTGDFNSTPGSYTIKQIRRYLKHAGPATSEKTFTTKPFTVENFSEDKLNWRIDYVFATPDIKFSKSEILKTQYSDHLPVRVEFEI